MKKLIPGLTALFITCLSGLLLTYFFYSRNSIEIEPVLLEPVVFEWRTLNNQATLSLCELAANTSAYRGREVNIEGSHISLLTSKRFVILTKCAPETAISANITLANGSEMDKGLLFHLSRLMSRRSESIDAEAEKVIIKGVVQGHNSSLEDFDIVANDAEIKFVVP